MHSIGVMHLMDKLLDTIQRKYPKDIIIMPKDREALELAALGHDIGHIAFSHSLENKSLKSHEERTIDLFKEHKTELNLIFGYCITDNVLKIFEYGKDTNARKIASTERIDILKLCSKLLMGTIDCDRMEYLITDRLLLTGDHVDYSRIFESINISKVNDSYTLAFDQSALPLIEDMLISRVHQYENVYCTTDDWIMRMLLRHYVAEEKWSESDICVMQEYDVLSHMHNVLQSGDKKSTIYHLAYAFLNCNFDSILSKTFTNDKLFDAFASILCEITNRQDIIETKWLMFKAYEPEKDAVYIKCNNGTIKDLAEVSTRLRDYAAKFGHVIVDIDSSYRIENEEMENIWKLFSM